MPEISLEQLKKNIKEKSFANIYYLYGNELFLIEKHSSQLIKAVLEGKSDEFSLLVQNDENFDLEILNDFLSSYSLLSQKKCAVIKSFDPEKLSGEDTKILLKIIEDISDDCYILLISQTPQTKNKQKAFLTKILPMAAVVSINTLKQNELVKLICDRCGKLDCEISKETASFLVLTVGSNLNTVLSEINKLYHYCRGRRITTEDIELVCSKSPEQAVYLLAKAVISGNFEKAYRLLDDYIKQKIEPVVIVSAMGGTFTDLYRAKAGSISNVKSDDVVRHFKYKTRFIVEYAYKDSARLSLKQISDSLSVIFNADKALKSSSAPGKTVLEKMIAELSILLTFSK